MSRIKIHRTGVSHRTGQVVVDLQSGERVPHTVVKPTDVILVDDIRRLLAEEPTASVSRLLELTK